VNHALIPAAGRSSRLGRSKALLPFGGKTVLEALLDTLDRGGVQRLRVVAAAGDAPLAALCKSKGIGLELNRRPERGMLSSIRVGVEALAPDLGDDDVVLICPVDYPSIRWRTISSILAAVPAAASAAVVTFDGRRAHPLALAKSAMADLERLDLEVGLRQIYERREVLEVAVDDPGTRADLDTWADYAALSRPR